MKFSFDVPAAAQRAARRALALQKANPLEDVGGMYVAEVLGSGVATLDVIGRMHRFFRINTRVYESELQLLHSETDSPLVRSWLMYGADTARRWVEGVYRKAVAEGFRPAEAATDLLDREPDEIYSAFSLGAWRFEYDLNPRKAARFVEEYHRATGWNLDLRRAFGESSGAVGNALYRRFHPRDPFREVARCLTVEDAEYRLAAEVDLTELTDSIDAPLEESLNPTVYVAPAATTAKMVWPAFVAYVILAVERPDLLVEMNKTSKLPPSSSQKPGSYAVYNDAVFTFISFFHPHGARWIDPMKSDEDTVKSFGSLPNDLWDLMVRAYRGLKIQPQAAQVLLGRARRWTAQNKFAGSLFHVFNADWKKGNWQHILDNIPEDADVRPAFETFVKDNPMPTAGVKLQQTLSDKALKQQVAEFLAGQGLIDDASVDFLDTVKVDDTQTGEAFRKLGTPLGVYSVVGHQGIAYNVLGAFKVNGTSVPSFVVRSGVDSKLDRWNDQMFAGWVEKDDATVLLAHKDMPGSSYAAKKKPTPTKTVKAEPDEPMSFATFSPKLYTNNPFAGVSAEPVGIAPAALPPKAKPEPPVVAPTPVLPPAAKFKTDDVVAWAGGHWLVVRSYVDDDGTRIYEVIALVVLGTKVSQVPALLLGPAFEQGVLKTSVGFHPLPLVEFIQFPSDWTPSTDTVGVGVSVGGQLLTGTSKQVVLRYYNHQEGSSEGTPYVLLAERVAYVDVSTWKLSLQTAASLVTVTPEYKPSTTAPELPHEADEPDAEQGEPELCGTQVALDYMAEKGWNPAIKSDSPLFIFPLGGRQYYGALKTRLIVGYAFDQQGTAVYVTVTEVQNVGWVTCLNAHKKYGPLDQMVQKVVDALLPKPGEKKQVFPKLNYKLSAQAKEIATSHGLIFVPAPKTSNFYVNTPLLDDAGVKVVLLGWVMKDGKDLRAVLNTAGVHPSAGYFFDDLDALNSKYTLRYEHLTEVSLAKGEVTFSKKPGEAQPEMAIYGGPIIPCAAPEGWQDTALLKQPALAPLDNGKHVAAGMLVVVSAGSLLKNGDAQFPTEFPSVVLYHPMGQYGGYKLNIPKGTVGEGESIQATAVREFWEETGLTAKPVAYLGDFRGNQSITRLYVGYVTGGTPYKKTQPEECDAVTFRSLNPKTVLDSDWYAQLVPTSGNKWQQHAIDALVAWLHENGLPQNFQPDTETEDAAPGKPDVPDPFKGVDPNPTTIEKLSVADMIAAVNKVVASDTILAFTKSIPPSDLSADIWKTLLFKCPFPMSSAMLDALQHQAKILDSVPVSFDCARKRLKGPEYGQAFETSKGTPYICGGYVAWMDTEGNPRKYMLALTGAGSVVVLIEGDLDPKVSTDQSLAAGPTTAWYTHPDPTINAAIAQVHKTGDLQGVSMKTFKEMWMKTAGVPAYAVITQNMLRDVASLFVPGACPSIVRDQILACLKARMKATHNGKKKQDPIVQITDVSLVPDNTGSMGMSSPVLKPPPSKVVLPTGPLSPILKQYVENPQPHLFYLADATPKTLTKGSKPSALLHGPGGKQWFAKWADGEPWRAQVDRAAYKLSELCKSNNIPIGVMEFSGKLVSFQPFADTAKSPPSEPNDLDEQNRAELLSQHAVDMFLGDHDGNVTNWIEVSGRILAVDRGQAFKFLLQGKSESLDPTWHAPGNHGQGYAKKLLIQWGKGEVEIPVVAWTSMLKTIRAVQKITGEQLATALSPVFDAIDVSVEQRAKVFSALVTRRDNYEKDWTKVLRKLRKTFEWPEIGSTAGPTKVFTSSPKDLKFGKREDKTIAEAVTARWQGKALKVGGLAFENQEVMVRRVMWEETLGMKVPATLLHFRVSRPAGIAAATKLYGSSNLEFTETLGGPQRLKVDQKGNFWEKIYAAIKTVNHHLFKQKDLAVNDQTVKTMSDMRPSLEGLLKLAADSSGTYGPTNEPNEAVYAMAEQYLQYLGIIEYWVAKKTELVGQHTPQLAEFVWEPPVPEHAISANAPPYRISLKKQGALWPTAVATGQDVHVTNLNKPVMNSAFQSQFVIEDPASRARIFWNPPGGLSSTGVEHVKDGVESLKGQGWAVVPGEPDAQTVAHLLKLFAEATGLDVRAADKDDESVLYWSRQANVLQGGGVVQPKSDHTSVIEPEYVKALAAYAKGDAKQAIAQLKSFVAQKTGQTVTQLEMLATPEEIEGHYTRGAGFVRHHRIGWTRERLQKEMGKECRLAHHLSDTPVDWMTAMKNNGALLANAIKAFYGVTKTGASPGEDMNRGGGQGLFLCFRKGFDASAGMIYFDISLALRLDVYIVGTGDTYGDTKIERYATPEKWIGLGAHQTTGSTGASSHKQVSIRHDIDIQQYLVAVMCGSPTARDSCIKIAKQMGWTFYGGAKPEDVFRVS